MPRFSQPKPIRAKTRVAYRSPSESQVPKLTSPRRSEFWHLAFAGRPVRDPRFGPDGLRLAKPRHLALGDRLVAGRDDFCRRRRCGLRAAGPRAGGLAPL